MNISQFCIQNEELNTKESYLQIHNQYIKDLSFENLYGPNIIIQKPIIHLNTDVICNKTKDHKFYEIIIKIFLKTTLQNNIVFIIELQYGALVTLNISDEFHHKILYIEIPYLLFPYIRKIIADLTSDGGFPPLMINKINFFELFNKKFSKK